MRMIVNIDVPKLEPAIRFYTEALDLRLSRILDSDVAELSGAGVVVCLLANEPGSQAISSVGQNGHGEPNEPNEPVRTGGQADAACRRAYTRHWTPVHIDFVVDKLAVSAERAVKAGAVRESECIEWRGSRCITFSDPFGHGFCLIEFDHGGYDGGPHEAGPCPAGRLKTGG